MSEKIREKIAFSLIKDEYGYPPADFEWLWAKSVGWGIFELDNIPFFVRCLALGDKVVAKRNSHGDLCYMRHKSHSGHSTLRILFKNPADVTQTREAIDGFGCKSELSHIPRLVAVDVPQSANFNDLRIFLTKGEEVGQWEVEESCIWDQPKQTK